MPIQTSNHKIIQSPYNFQSPFQALYVAALNRSPSDALALTSFLGDALVKCSVIDDGKVVDTLLAEVSATFFLHVHQDQQTRLWSWKDCRPAMVSPVNTRGGLQFLH